MTPVMDPRSRIRPRSERGFALLEVIVSAAVLAIVALAVLSGIDGAMSSTGREKARSIAASLAEKDQERLRTMPVEQLATYGIVNNPLNVQGSGNYNVQSKVEWVRDSTGGTVSCANDNQDADYLHITSTVTSNTVGTKISAVKIDSIVAPNIEYSTTHGSLAVKVVNAAGQVVPNVPVTAAGPVTLNGNTNQQGCALFEMIPTGQYTVTLSGPGMVDRLLNPTPSKSVTVSAGQLTTVTFEYDFAGSIAAAIETYKPGSTVADSSTIIPSAATRATAENGGQSSLLRSAPLAGPLAAPGAASITMPGLYPFSTAYSLYTGTCRFSNPTFGNANVGYFGNFPGAVAVAPGTPTSTKVRQPALNLQLQWYNLTGSPATKQATPNSLTVWAYPQPAPGDSCVEPRIPLTTFTTAASGMVGRSKPNNAYVEAGLPFGTYALCFQRTVASGSPTGTSYSIYPTDYGTTTPYDLRSTPFGPLFLTTLDGSASAKWHTTNGGGTNPNNPANTCPNTLVLP